MTEIGVIPEDWEVSNLGVIGEIKMCRRVFNYQTKPIDTIPFYKIGTFGKEADAYISKSLYDNYRKKFSFPRKGDILISAAGTIGRTVVYDGKPAYFQDSNIVWIDNNENLVFNTYLYYVYQVIKYDTEGGTIQRLYNSIIKNAEFAKPSKTEQQAIATILSDTDELISSLEALIAKKRRIKEGAMQELLTGKKRLAGFSGEWKVRKLGEIADFYKGKGLPKSDIRENGKNKCVHYGELFTLYKERIATIKSSTNSIEGAFLSKENDVLMPTSDVTPNGLATASCIGTSGVVLGGDILIIRSKNNDFDGTFVAYGVTLNRKLIMQLVSGSTVYHLYGSDMAKYEFLCPPTKEEQEFIAQILSDMDAEIAELEAKCDKYKLVKQGLMQVLLTGKIRLI